MSETDVGAFSTAQEGILYRRGRQSQCGVRPEMNDEPLVRFVRENPITTTILALGLGYLIAKTI